ncbi:MAG: glycosyltransferase family 39 protein [Chloroflexi bacterium]|nr:glycosyltransferase family 39 protein [Chloroflexota bacterium]
MKKNTNFKTFLDTSAKAQTFAALFIIMVFASVNISSVRRNFSLTTDEDKHILYGENIVAGDSTRIDDSKMPATALNALPKKLASFVENEKLKYFLNKLFVARSVTIFFSCLLAFLVFYWSRSLYGFIPALFSLTLYILDPNIIAHSQLVATDLYLTASISFAFFALWKFANKRSLRNGLVCLFALGIAQLAKYTAIILYPLFFITIFLYDTHDWIEAFRFRKNITAMILRYVQYVVFALMASLIIINLGFLFNRSFTKFGDYRLRSETLMRIQSDFPGLQNLPIPTPYPYLQGLDWMRNTEQTGNRSGNVYLLGRVSELEGFPGYYFVASLLKVPVATQIIYLMAMAIYLTRKNNKEHIRRNGIFFLVPSLFFAVYFNFFFNTQIGIRYYLPVFPLLYVFSGFLFVRWTDFSLIQKSLSFALLIYLFVSVSTYYPYQMSYMNELIGKRINSYKYLADSNLDWSQAKNEYQQYQKDNPGVLNNPNNPRPGYFIIRINDLVGVTQDPEKYAWLRDNFEPVESVAYAYLVYRVTPEQFDKLCATTTYCEK